MGVPLVVSSSRPASRQRRCEGLGGGVFPFAYSCRGSCIIRAVWAIRLTGLGVCGIGEVSDVVAFRFTVVRCRLSVLCAVSPARRSSHPIGVGDEPIRYE